MKKVKLYENEVLCLRTCDKDMKSYGGFQWPSEGTVTAPDWKPNIRCGKGLHGLLLGEGHGGLIDWSKDALWVVFATDETKLIDLGGKIKCETARVVFVGSRKDATNLIKTHYPNSLVIGEVSTSGDYGTSTSGDYGTSISGYEGTSVSGYRGTSVSGYEGTSISGDCGTSTSGDYGTSISGYEGTSMSGKNGIIEIIYHDQNNRKRKAIGYIGENGLEENVPYKLDNEGNFVKA